MPKCPTGAPPRRIRTAGADLPQPDVCPVMIIENEYEVILAVDWRSSITDIEDHIRIALAELPDNLAEQWEAE